MSTTYIGGGVLPAALLAGPIFVVSLAAGSVLATSAPIEPDLTWIVGIFAMTLAVPVGAFIAAIPLVIGSRLLGKLGASNIGARLPVTWALVGGIMAGCWVPFSDPDYFTVSKSVFQFAYPVTGALCALICRSRIRWPD